MAFLRVVQICISLISSRTSLLCANLSSTQLQWIVCGNSETLFKVLISLLLLFYWVIYFYVHCNLLMFTESMACMLTISTVTFEEQKHGLSFFPLYTVFGVAWKILSLYKSTVEISDVTFGRKIHFQLIFLHGVK